MPPPERASGPRGRVSPPLCLNGHWDPAAATPLSKGVEATRAKHGPGEPATPGLPNRRNAAPVTKAALLYLLSLSHEPPGRRGSVSLVAMPLSAS
jgi:hypothetical protein